MGPAGHIARATACVILLLLAIEDAAAARQPVGLFRGPELEGYRRLGWLYYLPVLRVRAFGYDDNLFLDRTGGHGDVVATLGPELRGVVRFGPRAWASLHGAVDFTGYGNHPALDHFDNERGAQVTSWVGDLRLTAGWDADRALRRPSSETDERVRIERSQTRLAAFYEMSSASTLEVGLSRSQERFDDPGLALQDTLGHVDTEIALTGRHRISPFTWAIVEVAETRRDGGGDGLRDLDQQRALAGLDIEPGPVLQGGFRVGRDFVAAPNRAPGDQNRFSGAGGRGDLSLRLTGRNRVKIGFSREFTPSRYLDDLFFRNDTVEVSLLREVTSRLAGEAGLSRGWNVYPDPGPFRRLDRIAEPFAGARLRLGQATVALRIGWWSRDSNLDGEDRDRFVISQSVTVPL